jgi:hypothetical protein
MASYSRKCRHCGRWVNLRQMPHDQWVAFEGDSPHKCKAPPPSRVARPAPAQRVGSVAKPFTPYYPTVPEPPTSAPKPPPSARPSVSQQPLARQQSQAPVQPLGAAGKPFSPHYPTVPEPPTSAPEPPPSESQSVSHQPLARQQSQAPAAKLASGVSWGRIVWVALAIGGLLVLLSRR